MKVILASKSVNENQTLAHEQMKQNSLTHRESEVCDFWKCLLIQSPVNSLISVITWWWRWWNMWRKHKNVKNVHLRNVYEIVIFVSAQKGAFIKNYDSM